MSRPLTILGIAFAFGMVAPACSIEPKPLPTAEAIKDLDRGQQPPLYQLLYDVPALPAFDPPRVPSGFAETPESEQGPVDPAQRAARQRTTAASGLRRRRYVEQWLGQERGVYDKIWNHLKDGRAVDDPAMAQFTHDLKESPGERERDLLRLQGIRAVMEAQQNSWA